MKVLQKPIVSCRTSLDRKFYTYGTLKKLFLEFTDSFPEHFKN